MSESVASVPPPVPAARPVVARRKYVRETAYLLLAILLAILGQGYLADRKNGSIDAGLVLYAIAVLLSTRVGGSIYSTPEATQSAEPQPTDDTGWLWPRQIRRPLVRGLVGGAAASLLVALVIFERGNGIIRNVAWALYLVGLILGLFIAWRLDQPGSTSRVTWTPRDSVSLAVVVALAAFYRLWNIGTEPAGLWYDEAAHGIAVVHLISDPAFRPVFLTTAAPEPALHWYFDAIFFLIFGPTIFALRISAILAGIVAVAGTYFLVRELFGWRTGFVAAAFLAVASWHVNFSRIMFDAIWSVTLNTLAAYFLIRALRTNRYRDYALAGLCIGLGLNNYYTTLLFCGVTACYLFYRFLLEPRIFLRRTLAGLVVLGAFVFLSVGPLLEFAVLHSDQYNRRFAQVSVFSEIQKQQSLDPLISNLQRHAEMFNYQGDPNGRHNLSGSPELDQVMGALFVLGLALVLRRWRDPRFIFPLIWFPVILAGGILSLSFEAPQSLRTIDNSVVTIIFAAIPLGALWSRLTGARLTTIHLPLRNVSSVAVSAGAVVAFAFLGWAAVLDYDKYFVRQAQDNRTWSEFSSPETQIGLEIRKLDLAATDVYLSSIFLGAPTIHFLAPNFHEEIVFDPVKNLPLSRHRPVVIFLSNIDDQSVLVIQRLYPRAAVQTFSSPNNSSPGLYVVSIATDDVVALQGLTADYYDGQQAAGKPVRTGRDQAIDFDWGLGPTPLPVPFTVSWHGVLAASQYGSYLLKVQGPPESELYVDEYLVLKGATQQTMTLAQGLHAFRMVMTVADPAPVHLQWQPPGSPVLVPIPPENLFGPPASARGLVGKYFSDPSWQGQPAKEQVDPTLKYKFQILRLPRPYSVDWTGKLDIPLAGVYSFRTDSIDSSWIYVDGNLVASNQGRDDRKGQGTVQLPEGMHDFEVKFQDLTGSSYLTVSWQPPGFPLEPVPSDRLFPPQGAYPERAGPLQQEKVQARPAAQPLEGPAPTQLARNASPTAIATIVIPSAIATIGQLTISPLRRLQTFGEPGDGSGQLKSARGVAVDAAGDVYIVDTALVRVEKFDPSGKFLLAWGAKGEGGQDQFQEPVDLVVNAQGQVDVLDSTTGLIKRFTSDGTFITQFGGPALGMSHPRALAIDAPGNIYVAVAGNSHVVKLTPNGDLFQKFGEHGSGPGQITEPVGVAVAADFSIYVADSATNRLSHFDSAFHLIQAWPLPRSSSVIGPKILVAEDQTVFVSDPEGHRIIHFDQRGQPIDQLVAAGELRRPLGLRNNVHGQVYVADVEAGRVYEFGTP